MQQRTVSGKSFRITAVGLSSEAGESDSAASIFHWKKWSSSARAMEETAAAETATADALELEEAISVAAVSTACARVAGATEIPDASEWGWISLTWMTSPWKTS